MNGSRLFVVIAAGMLLVGLSCNRSIDHVTGDTSALRGAGSTFAEPLFDRWIDEYRREKTGANIKYDAVGSGEGQERFFTGRVDFAATDAHVTNEQLAAVDRGAIMIPIAMGGIAIAYNPAGLPDGIKLPRDVYVDIFLGKIPYWNDPRIVAANTGITLPRIPISRIVRLDSSGTTFTFTSHLSSVSTTWQTGPGAGKLVSWPGAFQTAAGNERVAGLVKQVQGGISYVEYGTARGAGLRMAMLENKRGEFVKPSNESISASLLAVSGALSESESFYNPDANNGYPIVTRTWLLTHKQSADRERANAVKEFIGWALTTGQASGETLGYVRLPKEMAAEALAAIYGVN